MLAHDLAPPLHPGIHAGASTGFRRLTPSLLRADHAAEDFDGLSPRLVHTIDWLFRFTQPQDWGKGGRPIVWPSASLQQDALGLSPTQVKGINRALIEAGLISMKDSPNGKRYGHRDRQGQITEAYGFDLSPIAARYAEFVRVAEVARVARVERAEMGRLRRRATIARNGITQILETAAEYGFQGEEWATLARDSRNLARGLRNVERIEEMALGVESLERRQRTGRERLEMLLSAVTAERPEAVNSDPKGAENRPHQYTYKPDPYPEQGTVVAHEGCNAPAETPVLDTAMPEPLTEPQETQPVKPARSDGTVLQLSTDELVRMAPRLRPYLVTPVPTWPEVVNAADWLRGVASLRDKGLTAEKCDRRVDEEWQKPSEE